MAGSLLVAAPRAHADDGGISGTPGIVQPGDPGEVDPNNPDDWADLQYGDVDPNQQANGVMSLSDIPMTVSDFTMAIPGQRVYLYQDSDGPGKMKIAPGSFNPATVTTSVTVLVAQNGGIVQGKGHWQRLLSGRYRVTFTLNVYGFPFQFQGLLSASRRSGFGLYDGWGYEDFWQIAS
jgi:hypothetical protein